MPRPDVCVVGEINPDLILYGLPKEIKPEQETLVEGFRLTLGSSSAIFAHNLAVLGTNVGIVSKIGNDPFGKMSVGWLEAGGVDVTHVSVAKTTATGLSVILAHPSERLFGSDDAIHVNTTGAKLIAQTVYDQVVALGWVPK